MLHVARLQTFGYWGDYVPGMTFDVTAGESYKAAAKNRSGNTGLYALRRDTDTMTGGADSAIMLRYGLTFPQSINATSAWSVVSGGSSYFKQLPRAFRKSTNSDSQGLAFVRYEANQGGQWTNNSLISAANIPFSLRFFLPDPPEDMEDQIIQASWDNWLFRFKDGSPEIKLNRSDWDWQSLSFEAPRGVTFDGTYNNPITFTFIPEPRGALNVILEGIGSDTIEIPHIINTRQIGTIWNASVLSISTNGGGFAWQAGYPEFGASGVLRFGESHNGVWTSVLGDMSVNGAYDDSLAGTSVTIEKEDLDSDSFEIKATLATSNNRFTPFLYSATATIEGGDRDGSSTISWDSNDHLKDDGTTIIEDVTPSFEGEMRRFQYGVQISDINGGSLAGITGDFFYEALENRMGTLIVDGEYLIRNGIIKNSLLTNMKGATPNQIRSAVTNSNTKVNPTICDQWARMDEDIMYDSPIGDDMLLWPYVRLILKNGGVKESEMAGVPTGAYGSAAGRRLPKAAFGESPAVRPSAGITRGDYLRSIVDQFGMGDILFCDPETGWWTARTPSTSVATDPVSGLPFAFHRSSTSPNDSSDFPGRYTILSPLDFSRDSEEQYNYFRVEGGLDAYGKRLAAEWTIWESIQASGTPGNRKFIGRVKPYPTVQNDGLRTKDDVQWVLRSLVSRYGLPGRFLAFETYFHPKLYPGDYITVDGVGCRVKRISGSIATDKMQITAQEVA